MKNGLLPIFFCFSLSSTFALAAPLMCEDVFLSPATAPQVTAQAVNLASALKSVPAFVSAVISPKEQAITWESFSAIETLKAQAISYSEKIKTMTPEERKRELRNFLRLIDEDAATRELYDALAQPEAMEYLPAQYHLRKKLYSDLAKALKVLPKDFRIPVGRVPGDQRLAKINKDSRKFMKEMDGLFEKIIPSTGYENYAAYEKFVRSSEDPLVKKAVDLLDQHQLEVIMRRPEAGRFWIPITGIQNQYVSGSSRGYMGKDGRYGVESILTNHEKADYAKLDDELKPKYGTLRMSEDSGVKNSISASSDYGSDIYTFKEDAIQDRLSIFFGDSLNHIANIDYAWGQGRKGPATVWETMFVPWNRRLLMVPYMIEGLRNNSFGDPSKAAAPEVPMANRHERRHNYWESQIFGRVNLDIVKTFEFEENPPAGEFLAELKKHDIKIIDHRMDPAKEWDGN